MKLLMIYADKIAWKTTIKTLDSVDTVVESKAYEDVLVGFIQMEEVDENDVSKVETKLVKNLKWAAKKNNTENIILHSFAHLSISKAQPETVQQLFGRAQKRLENAGYKAYQTPFGYFLDLDVVAPGRSLARIFKEF